MIVFIKQTAVFVTGRNFLVTFPMNVFTTKLCVSGESSVSPVWALPLAGKNVEKQGEKAFLAYFSQEGKKTNGRHGGLNLFCQRVMDAVSRGWDIGFANQSFSPSAPLGLFSNKLLWLKFLPLSNSRERNSFSRTQWEEVWRIMTHKQ